MAWNGPCMVQEPLKWILARPIDVPWVVSDQKSPKKKVQKMGQKVKILAEMAPVWVKNPWNGF